MEKSNPDRADVHMLLEHAYTGVRNTQSAMREADLWLAADPNAVADMHLQEDIRNAALIRDVQDDAFALLESKMGMRGIDILYDIAYGSSGRMYPQAAARAKKALDQQRRAQAGEPRAGACSWPSARPRRASRSTRSSRAPATRATRG